MRAIRLASCAAAVICCSSLARAQTPAPRFTIVSITSEPPGPIAPGAKFKIKVKVRNDGDTIPAGRRFDFAFTSPDAIAIGQPTGTPALFFGFCPGATPTNMICQCFAAWERGQTVEMETEVTVGSSARGTSTVTFRVSSGTVAETASVTVQIVLAGPDLVPDAYLDSAYNIHPSGTRIRGRSFFLLPFVANIGTMPTQGPWNLTALVSAGLKIYGTELKTHVWTSNSSIHSGSTFLMFDVGALVDININELGVQSIVLTVSGGGDVEPSNNSKTFQFEVIPEDPDPLNRLDTTRRLAEIGGR